MVLAMVGQSLCWFVGPEPAVEVAVLAALDLMKERHHSVGLRHQHHGDAASAGVGKWLEGLGRWGDRPGRRPSWLGWLVVV